jgi:molecular chaperone DnaJ
MLRRAHVLIASRRGASFQSRRSLSSKKRDYYEILGLRPGATKAEIKKSYFDMAKKYHPDVNKEKGADAKFKEVTEAYEVLEDDQKRQMYDNFGHDAANAQDAGSNPFAGGFGNMGGFGMNFNGGGGQAASMEDIMDMLGAFGQMGGQSRDIQARVRISFFEAANGCKKDVEAEYYAVTGGRGRQQRERKKKRLTIDIPPGVNNQMVLRVPGEGSGEGRNAGDMLVEIEVEPDAYFKRQDHDIYVDVNVPLSMAVLGGNVDVLTLDGVVSVKVPAGMQPNSRLVLRDKGIKRLDRSGRGSQYMVLKLQVPSTLSARQRELMEEFSKEEGKASQPKSFAESAWRRLKAFMGDKWCEPEKKKDSEASAA